MIKLWHRLLCYLGKHHYVIRICTNPEACGWFTDSGPIVCSVCKYSSGVVCEHCGKKLGKG